MKKIPNEVFYLPIIILGINFIARLIDQSKLLFYFPLDTTNDFSSYMAQLFFLFECGFQKFCPYWYNSFTTFIHSPPGWYFFTTPLYWLFQDVKIATYVSLILIFIIAFIFIWYLGKLHKFSKIKRITFFLFLFGNAIAIGNFIRLGRIPELFAWTIFVAFALLILYYKNKKLQKYFYFIIILYAILILSYHIVAIFASLLLLGLLLYKPFNEKIKIVVSGIISLILTSFWWIPFLINIKESGIGGTNYGGWLWHFNQENLLTNIAASLIPLVLLFLFYIYWRNNKKSKKELIFFSPILLINLLFLFRLTPLIPILNKIFPDPYLTFFMFFIIFFLLKIDLTFINKYIKYIIYIGIILFAILSVTISLIHTPNFIIPNDT
ncbi:hypothetical protein K8R47_02390, partial [archaeon]|nr:hypothetical protein [archaeon]